MKDTSGYVIPGTFCNLNPGEWPSSVSLLAFLHAGSRMHSSNPANCGLAASRWRRSFSRGGGHCHGHWDVVVSRLLPRTLAVVTRPALVRLLQIHPLEIGPSTLQPSKPTHEAVVYTF